MLAPLINCKQSFYIQAFTNINKKKNKIKQTDLERLYIAILHK